MNNFLISTVAAINIFLSPVAPNAILVSEGKAEAKSEKKEVIRLVKPSESLSSIAIEYYGDESYWTTIWNDNSWIESPYIIEPGWEIKLRIDKPEKPETLSLDLAKRIKPASDIAKVSQVQPQAPAANQPSVPAGNGPLNETQIQFLGNCESGMTASRNSGNGYYGAFQFAAGTWNRMGTGYARADMAPLEVQVDAVQSLVQRSNIFGQFPACSRRMQALGLI